MTEPTNDEIDALVAAYLGDCGPQATRVYNYTRAVLALWGSPPPKGEPVAWNGLTDEDRERAMNSMPGMLEGFTKTWGWLHFAKAIEAICREKNAQPAPASQEDAALPMQPICVASDGVVRFKKNRMVNDMYEFSQPRGFGLNEMARGDYTQEERMQFAQLIGYSVSGYGSLSYASSESVEKADAIADLLIAARKQGVNND